jgi:hypothetical protein
MCAAMTETQLAPDAPETARVLPTLLTMAQGVPPARPAARYVRSAVVRGRSSCSPRCPGTPPRSTCAPGWCDPHRIHDAGARQGRRRGEVRWHRLPDHHDRAEPAGAVGRRHLGDPRRRLEQRQPARRPTRARQQRPENPADRHLGSGRRDLVLRRGLLRQLPGAAAHLDLPRLHRRRQPDHRLRQRPAGRHDRGELPAQQDRHRQQPDQRRPRRLHRAHRRHERLRQQPDAGAGRGAVRVGAGRRHRHRFHRHQFHRHQDRHHAPRTETHRQRAARVMPGGPVLDTKPCRA